MYLEDCKNYRADFREAVELCITGKATKEQALQLLEFRYEFATIDVKKQMGGNLVLLLALISQESTENLNDKFIEACKHNYASKGFVAAHTFLEKIREELILCYENDVEVLGGKEKGEEEFYEMVESARELHSKNKAITELYEICKSKIEVL